MSEFVITRLNKTDTHKKEYQQVGNTILHNTLQRRVCGVKYLRSYWGSRSC